MATYGRNWYQVTAEPNQGPVQPIVDQSKAHHAENLIPDEADPVQINHSLIIFPAVFIIKKNNFIFMTVFYCASVRNLNQNMKQPAQKFVIKVPVKTYVKRFLEINYGEPINFSENTKSHQFFKSLLQKTNTGFNKHTEFKPFYPMVVEVEISEHDFEHFGWDFPFTGVVSFNRYFEKQAKMLMRNIIGVNVSLGMPIKTAIENFQFRFKFDEDVWKAESIKKDFYRYGKLDAVDFNNEIFKKIERIVLQNLYDKRTVSLKLFYCAVFMIMGQLVIHL